LLLDPGLPNIGLFAGVWTGPGSTALPFTAPLQASLLGLDVFAQGLLVDLAPATSVPFALTNGLRLRLGS
jgi:hypothetical protein